MLPALNEATTEAGIACQEHCYDELGNAGRSGGAGWGGQEKARLRVDEEEVAHEPSRLPAELIAQRHPAGATRRDHGADGAQNRRNCSPGRMKAAVLSAIWRLPSCSRLLIRRKRWASRSANCPSPRMRLPKVALFECATPARPQLVEDRLFLAGIMRIEPVAKEGGELVGQSQQDVIRTAAPASTAALMICSSSGSLSLGIVGRRARRPAHRPWPVVRSP